MKVYKFNRPINRQLQYKKKDKMTELQKQALALLNIIHKKQKIYSELNSKIRDLQGDFPTHIQSIDTEYFTGVVDLLDEILGDELADYLLWETDGSDRYFNEVEGITQD